MTVSTINSLFTLFSGETDTEKYSPLVSSAVTQVQALMTYVLTIFVPLLQITVIHKLPA